MFTKTVCSTDRPVALPGRLNLTPRLRGEVDLRGAAEIAPLPYGIAIVEVELTPPLKRSVDQVVLCK